MHKLQQKNKQRKNARHFLKSHKESFFRRFCWIGIFWTSERMWCWSAWQRNTHDGDNVRLAKLPDGVMTSYMRFELHNKSARRTLDCEPIWGRNLFENTCILIIPKASKGMKSNMHVSLQCCFWILTKLLPHNQSNGDFILITEICWF